VRALAIAAGLAACSFHAAPAGTGSDGGTVHHDTRPPDAPADARRLDGQDAPACPAACTQAGGTCTGSDACQIVVTGESASCPAGFACTIECEGANSACNGTLDCQGTTSCTIDCNSSGGCNGTVECAGATCTLDCNSPGTCNSGQVDDGSGGACTLNCCSPGTCNNESAIPQNCANPNQC